MNPLGVQWTADLYGCDAALLDDQERIGAFMLEAARVAMATIISSQFHKFAPQGVSGVVVIAESHIAIHTWPELGYAALDVFTCGDRLLAEEGFRRLAERLGATEVACTRHVRGDPRRIAALQGQPTSPAWGLRSLVLVAVLFVWGALAPNARAQGVPGFPLDPLNSQEYWAVYDVLRATGHADDDTHYASVHLRPPPKAAVLAWKPGDALHREAEVTVINAGRSFDAVVDVTASKLLSWSESPGTGAMTSAEQDGIADLLRGSPEFMAGLKKRGYTDLSRLACWGYSPGYYARPEEKGHRLAQASCYDRHGSFNGWGGPVENLSAVVDLGDKKVIKVIDTGVIPVPTAKAGYDPATVGPTRPRLDPIVEMPHDPGFTLTGNEVSWQNWDFRFRLEPRSGAVVSNVTYKDGDRVRPVMYEGALSELFVPYMDPSLNWYNATYFDLGELGDGGLPRPLEPGDDCPTNATYLHAVFAGADGIPVRVTRAACLFERQGGEIAWSHFEETDGSTESRPRRDLVLRWIATIGNYDYIFDWEFQQDGSITVNVGATGIVATKGVETRDAHAQKGETGPHEDPYGRYVAPNTVAVNHDHFFCFRLDLDVDGPQNSFVVDHLETKRLPQDSPRKSVWVVRSQIAAKESQAQLDGHMPELWRVINPTAIGPLGYPTSYEIRAGHSAGSLLSPDDYPQERAGFTSHALWVTPQRDDELYAAGKYVWQSEPGQGLPAWTKADRAIASTDIVVWYTIGMHHVVRAEDWPLMPTTWHSFEIRPFDFFARNPALDLPKP